MQDQRFFQSEKPLASRMQKKRPTTQKGSRSQDLRSPSQFQVVAKGSKRSSSSNEASQLFQNQEKSNSDSFTRSDNNDDYRALRRKYLFLEEESFDLGKECDEVEDEIKALEEEKLALLDDLIVLEGLVDPSEVPSHGPRLQ